MGLLGITTTRLRNLGTFYFPQPLAVLLAVTTPRSSQDWTVPQNDDLWQDDFKTFFDPCPPGWRVPKSGAGILSPWNAFGTNPYAAPFFFYINGVKQTAAGIPVFVEHPNNGRRYEADGTKAWYPASGLRGAGSVGLFGALGGAGYQGFNWPSTVSGTSVVHLGFNYGSLNPSYRDSRAYGFPVRCIRE